MPRIIISIEGVVIKEVQLTQERTTLGRRPYNDVVIDNLAVSGEHALLQMSGGETCIEDLNSTNGTFVNGKAIRKEILQNNDTIEIAKYRIRFLTEAPARAVQPAPVNEALSSDTVDAVLSSDTAAVAVSAPVAAIRVLSGASAGREVPLLKPVTRIGKPGVAVAAITRGTRAFYISDVEGGDTSILNGSPLGAAATELKHGDLLELAGTQMAFMQPG